MSNGSVLRLVLFVKVKEIGLLRNNLEDGLESVITCGKKPITNLKTENRVEITHTRERTSAR